MSIHRFTRVNVLERIALDIFDWSQSSALLNWIGFDSDAFASVFEQQWIKSVKSAESPNRTFIPPIQSVALFVLCALCVHRAQM